METSPLLTVLSYSGGTGSTALLHMVLRGEIERPESLAVLNADPGMENSETYRHVAAMADRCREAGIYFETVPGPNLYQDLLDFKDGPATRLNNPPYWTKNADGSRGRLRQSCTRYYKIAPMDRAVRRLLHEWHGISPVSCRLGTDIVCKWIGFTRDEVSRIKPAEQKYVYFDYPLINMGLRKADLTAWYAERGLEMPPRSVCNACFANGLAHYRDMYLNRPQDWKAAVRVDNAVRDMSKAGIESSVYVSPTLRSLVELAEMDFVLDGEDMDKWSCDSGYCFT